MIEHLNKDTFNQAVNDQEHLVVVDFFATWCGPCKMLAPVLEKAASEMDQVRFYKVDIDQESDLTEQFQIMSVPTMVFFKKGQKVLQHSGLVNSDTLNNMIAQAK